jgi:hypothetical protein
MRYKLMFVTGFVTGYVMGAKAGRKRYDAIANGVRRLADSPVVQEAAGVFQAQASGAVASAKSSVSSKVSDQVSSRLRSYRSSRRFGGGPTSDTDDPRKAPAYPQAGHQEFGADT